MPTAASKLSKKTVRLVIIGHSYCRRLGEFLLKMEGDAGHVMVDGTQVVVTYVHQGGVNYAFFNGSPYHKRLVVDSKPDVVLVVLGGNAVGRRDPIPQGVQEMRKYHGWLKGALPNAIIVCAEVEPRYNHDPSVPKGMISPLDRDGTHRETYWFRRSAFNQAINRMKDKDFTLRTAKYLNRREFFDRGGVHLNDRGNHFYWGLIKDCLAKVILRFHL